MASECKRTIIRLRCATSKSSLWDMGYVSRGGAFKCPCIYHTSKYTYCTHVYTLKLVCIRTSCTVYNYAVVVLTCTCQCTCTYMSPQMCIYMYMCMYLYMSFTCREGSPILTVHSPYVLSFSNTSAMMYSSLPLLLSSERNELSSYKKNATHTTIHVHAHAHSL